MPEKLDFKPQDYLPLVGYPLHVRRNKGEDTPKDYGIKKNRFAFYHQLMPPVLGVVIVLLTDEYWSRRRKYISSVPPTKR